MNWFKRKQETQSIELVVHDMRCANCEASVKLALRKVAGVDRVKVNRRRKQVVITVKPEHAVTVDRLAAGLATSGYRAEPA
jgi:copper chaperone CopZ